MAILASAAHAAEDWERFRDEVPHTRHSVSLGREEGLMSDPAKKAASRAASRKIAVALRGLSYDDAYSLLSGRLHACFDRLPDASVNMLLMFFITHAMEARAEVAMPTILRVS